MITRTEERLLGLTSLIPIKGHILRAIRNIILQDIFPKIVKPKLTIQFLCPYQNSDPHYSS